MLDPDRQHELEEFGFTVVPFLSPAELDTLRVAARALGAAPDDPRIALNWSFHSRSREHKDAVQALLPGVEPAIRRAFVDHVAYLTTFITKWPGPHSAFPPHQDPSLVDERSHTGVTVWVPLLDVDETNGMLHMVPGSHRFSRVLRGQDVDRSPFAGLDEVIVGELGRGVPLTAGEALVFDNRAIHYSLPNHSDGPRIVLSLGLRPRRGRCVVVRPIEGDAVELHEVADDFYVDVLPAQRDRWTPTTPPIATITNPSEHWTADALRELAALVGDAPRAVRSASPANEEALDPGVFCALCGSSEGLDAADRAGRSNAQLVCPSCATALQD